MKVETAYPVFTPTPSGCTEGMEEKKCPQSFNWGPEVALSPQRGSTLPGDPRPARDGGGDAHRDVRLDGQLRP